MTTGLSPTDRPSGRPRRHPDRGRWRRRQPSHPQPRRGDGRQTRPGSALDHVPRCRPRPGGRRGDRPGPTNCGGQNGGRPADDRLRELVVAVGPNGGGLGCGRRSRPHPRRRDAAGRRHAAHLGSRRLRRGPQRRRRRRDRPREQPRAPTARRRRERRMTAAAIQIDGLRIQRGAKVVIPASTSRCRPPDHGPARAERLREVHPAARDRRGPGGPGGTVTVLGSRRSPALRLRSAT